MPIGPNLRSIIAINFTFLMAVILGALAWLIWPETAQGWRLGVLSILLFFGAFSCLIAGLAKVLGHVMRDIPVHQFHSQGRKPQPDKLAHEDTLRKSGIIE